jgi:hypothetical protein
VIHRLSPWTLLITAREVFEGWFLGSISTGIIGRCGWPSRCDRPYSMLCDEPPSVWNQMLVSLRGGGGELGNLKT